MSLSKTLYSLQPRKTCPDMAEKVMEGWREGRTNRWRDEWMDGGRNGFQRLYDNGYFSHILFVYFHTL